MSEVTVRGVEKALEAEASSAHSRINISLNLDNWKNLDVDVQELLLWFHQHVLDAKMSWDDCADALGYDRSTIFKILKGMYEGSWKNVCAAIKGYKRIIETRGTIQANTIVDNGITRMVGAGLDYALANNSITMVIGESRMGKSEAARLWRDRNNHGTSVFVTAPPLNGTKMLLRAIAEKVGIHKNLNTTSLYESICRSFNKNRILIVDEAHRLLPGDRRSNPINLEVLRDLHDQTHCGLALIATQRFDDELKKSTYQFEQILGRIGMPVRLYRKMRKQDFMPIVEQYCKDPSERLQEQCQGIANEPGRLGILVEVLKMASRIASKAKTGVNEECFFKALAIRRQMMGETQYAKA